MVYRQYNRKVKLWIYNIITEIIYLKQNLTKSFGIDLHLHWSESCLDHDNFAISVDIVQITIENRIPQRISLFVNMKRPQRQKYKLNPSNNFGYRLTFVLMKSWYRNGSHSFIIIKTNNQNKSSSKQISLENRITQKIWLFINMKRPQHHQ